MSDPQAETKLCPICSREIKQVARKCRFCGEHFQSEADFERPHGSDIWRDGNQLVMSWDAQLPYVCIKTNRPADVWLPRTVSWYPKWTLFLVPLGALVFFIVAGLLRKQAKIRVGLCEARRAARVRTIVMAWVGSLLGLGFLVGASIWADRQPSSPAPMLMVFGIALFFISALFGALKPRIVSAGYMTVDYIWLKGAHPSYLARFPQFPGVDHIWLEGAHPNSLGRQRIRDRASGDPVQGPRPQGGTATNQEGIDREATGREGTGREGTGREGTGRDRVGMETNRRVPPGPVGGRRPSPTGADSAATDPDEGVPWKPRGKARSPETNRTTENRSRGWFLPVGLLVGGLLAMGVTGVLMLGFKAAPVPPMAVPPVAVAPPANNVAIDFWQLQPDPLPVDERPAANRSLPERLSFPADNEREIAFPYTSRRFVALGGLDSGYKQRQWEIRDLSTGDVAGRISDEYMAADTWTLSPDGAYLAVVRSGPPKLIVWEVKTGQRLGEVPVRVG
jgi:hypothetical protein